MQLTTAHLIVNPCDDEEDNMAMLCCHSDKGEMSMRPATRTKTKELTWDYEPSTLDGLKITLSDTTCGWNWPLATPMPWVARTTWTSPTAPDRKI
jgi:hypothetical protein